MKEHLWACEHCDYAHRLQWYVVMHTWKQHRTEDDQERKAHDRRTMLLRWYGYEK